MAIDPVRVHIPKEVDDGESVVFILENELNTTCNDPVCFFWNTSAESITLQVEYLLSFGVSGNPLQAGDFLFDLVTSQVVLTGARVEIPIKTYSSTLVSTTSTASPITHRITLTNASGSDVIVRFILSGWFENDLRAGSNSFIYRQGV